MEIVIGVIAKVAEYTVAPIAGPFIKFWKYKSNLENLKKEVKELEARRDSVQLQIKVGEKPLPDVKLWLDKVNSIIVDVSVLVSEDNPEQQNMQCCKGFTYSSLKKCYQRRKNIPLKLKDVVELEASEFKEVSHRTTPEMNQPRKESEVSESRMSISREIIAALSDSDVNMVGIYGTGGVGKTTLARQVETQAMQDKLFNKIAFVEVSQSPDIKTIQGVIADYLGLQFNEESVPGRARKLCEVLKKEEKILLIIDNIWGSINFEEVGIPSKNDSKELKLLLTTRSFDVLTKEMDSQRNFHVEALCEADAWSLFKSKAGTCVDHPHLKSVAQEVAKKCGGMPVAIVTIAKALKDTEAEDEWKDALQRLNNPSSDSFEGITEHVYKSIKLSYDYLDGKLKEIFLLCSRMGRTYDASIQDLFRYGVGLGLFRTFNTLEEALCNVYSSVNKLKSNSLLLDAPKSRYASERFAMHDVVCDVARSISTKDQNVFNVIDVAIPWDWTNGDSLRLCTSITLHNIGELPDDLKLVCPQLKFLCVKPKDLFLRIPFDFFKGMSVLQVLHLIQMDLRRLPTSLRHLEELRTLCFDYCKLGDINIIGELKNLQILSFRGSMVEKLSEEMHQLTKLRLLDLTNCSYLRVIPPKVMSSFKKLEALYMANSFINWDVEKSNNERRNASLDELEHFSGLTILEINLPNAALSRGLLSPKLERYNINIEESYLTLRDGRNISSKTSRTLEVKLNTNEYGVISRLRGVRELVLHEVPGIANILYDLDREGFPELEYLTVHCNSQLLHIVDTISCDDAFPSLKSLVLWYSFNLKKICNGPLGVESFRQLRTIRVKNCNTLINFFSFATDRVFQELEKIEVHDCENMEEILAIGEEVHEINLSKLRILILKNLPRLKSFCCNVKTASPMLQLASETKAGEIISEEEEEEEHDIPTPLFNNKVAFSKLETLVVINTNVEMIWDNQLSTISFVQTLTCLIIDNLSKLRRLWSENFIIEFPSLKEMTIRSCPKLEFIFDNKVENSIIEFPSLKEMKIQSCPKLEFIFDNKEGVVAEEMPAIAQFIFPKLTSLELYKLPKLESFYPGRHTMEWPVLNMLKMHQCGIHDMKEKGVGRQVLSEEQIVHCKFLTSDGLKVQVEWIWLYLLQTMGSWVQNLTMLSVYNCGDLKELFPSSLVELREKEIRNTISFPKLSCLVMDHFQNLTRLCSGYYIEFPSLIEFKISNCPELKACIFDDKVGVSNLEKIQVVEMDNLKMIWHNQLSEDSFSKLKSFEVKKCQELLTIFPSNKYRRISSLESLIVEECKSLVEIFDLQGINSEERPSIIATKIGEFCTDDPQIAFSFASLQNLEVTKCQSLKNLFSTSIVAKEGVTAKEAPTTAMFVFPKLTVLKLYKLPDKCQMQQCLFSLVEKAFPCLEELTLAGEDLTMMWQEHDTECLFKKFKILQILDEFVEFKDYIFYEDVFYYQTIFRYIGDVKYMWKQNFKLDLILPNFEEIKVRGCDKFISLMPLSASFQNLTSLIVYHCHNLGHILTCSVAKSLVKLIKMRISYCEKIKEVVGNQEVIAEGKIIFSNLKSLSLKSLPSLTSFCSWNFTLEFQSLEILEVFSCPNMKIFSQGNLITQRLQDVRVDAKSVQLCPDIDLNTTLQKFHDEKKECQISIEDEGDSSGHHMQ